MGTRERRLREAQERRQRILAAARRLFWKQGFADTTMPQIAQAAELASGTLYLYFPSKSALYAELLVEGYQMLEAQLRRSLEKAAASPSTDPMVPLEVLIQAFLDFARTQPEYFRIIFFVLQAENTAGRQAALGPTQMRRLESYERTCKDLAARLLLEGGLCKPDQASICVDALWSMLAGVVFYWAGTPMFDVVAQTAQRILLNGLKPIHGDANISTTL